MPVPSSAYSVLLLATDAAIHAQVRQVFTDASITIAYDVDSLQRGTHKDGFDVVIIEAGGHEQGDRLEDQLGLSQALVIKGSRAVLKKTLKMIQLRLMDSPNSRPHAKTNDGSIEGYLESKMGDFVKGMRNGSARNLHPILISAVERPLITSALKETRGNQIRAAELLGLNRNTLRKKIVDLHIPLQQTKMKASRSA
ncbi:MAG: helix-turn-helix domain-containing protein [Nitrospira sp.]